MAHQEAVAGSRRQQPVFCLRLSWRNGLFISFEIRYSCDVSVVIMVRKKSDGISVDKLITIFRKIGGKRPEPREADYSRWNQTEEEYQQEQSRWEESVRRKKKQSKPDRNSSR